MNEPKKVCKHKPGEEWADGCCSPKPSPSSNFHAVSGQDSETSVPQPLSLTEQ